jgi:uncharacterized protein (TIGR00251 family)
MPSEARPFTISAEDIMLRVKAFPKSERNRIVGVRNGELVVRIQAPAVKGQANKELLRFLSKALSVPKSEMRIVFGETSRHKVIRLPGSARTSLEEAL